MYPHSAHTKQMALGLPQAKGKPVPVRNRAVRRQKRSCPQIVHLNGRSRISTGSDSSLLKRGINHLIPNLKVDS